MYLQWHRLSIRHTAIHLLLVLTILSACFAVVFESRRLIDVVPTLDLMLSTIFVGWYTLLHYLLGFTDFFKKNVLARLVYCDIPFFVSSVVLISINIKVPKSGWEYLLPGYGYFPISILYLFISSIVLGFWTYVLKDSVQKYFQ